MDVVLILMRGKYNILICLIYISLVIFLVGEKYRILLVFLYKISKNIFYHFGKNNLILIKKILYCIAIGKFILFF